MKEEMSERLKELLEIQKSNKGILFPEKVVEAAENPKGALHDAFEWDETGGRARQGRRNTAIK